MIPLSAAIWPFTIAGVLALPAATVAALYRGGIAAGVGRRAARTVTVAAAAAWSTWIVVSGLLAFGGAYRQQPDSARPWIGVACVAGVLAALLASRIPIVATILAGPGMPGRLALAQTPRVVGAVFLIALAVGQLPPVFALPAGIGDVAVGLAAPLVARRWVGRGRLRAFNVLGLADLVLAVSLGFLAGLGPARLLAVSPSTAALGLLPLVLIPTTGVPLAAALHLVSLRRLRRDAATPPASVDPVSTTGAVHRTTLG